MPIKLFCSTLAFCHHFKASKFKVKNLEEIFIDLEGKHREERGLTDAAEIPLSSTITSLNNLHAEHNLENVFKGISFLCGIFLSLKGSSCNLM